MAVFIVFFTLTVLYDAAYLIHSAKGRQPGSVILSAVLIAAAFAYLFLMIS